MWFFNRSWPRRSHAVVTDDEEPAGITHYGNLTGAPESP